ncbi:Ger(x)C family spore germination protein [Paenibacillus qinlingensis]|uniref:Ger(x)C family spore germination protein n=1 Tax=Paenibacillus qinlingensis TaxID=1837343 RepID=UPI001567C5A3|nr:Ger(x)C family spore germination protein [Paenibacillus qinlingensis]NQX58509.1 Ger(x)C family spore germination protein [Paenibacillus qinlingensis]
MYKYLILLFCFVLFGCAKEQIVDRIKLIQSIGFDLQEDTFKVSGTYYAYNNKVGLSLMNGEAKSFNEVLTLFTAQSDHPIAIGQLRTMMISDTMARRGISNLATTIIRDPLMSNNAILVLTNEHASDVLSETLKHPPSYLSNLIKQNMESGNTPVTNGHLFLDQYFGEGQDVYLPILFMNPQGILQMDGVGVFHHDKLKLTLSSKEGLLIKLLKDDRTNVMTSTYNFIDDQNKRTSFKIMNAKRKVSVQNNTAKISLQLNIELRDYPAASNAFENKKDMLELKKQFENHLTNDIKITLENFQKNRVDPIGFGHLTEIHQRNWNEEDFNDHIYSAMKFDVQTEINILFLGVGH